MRKFGEPEILALTARWRTHAKRLMRQAEEAANARDVARLAGMASSLECAARDLCAEAEVDEAAGALIVSREVERQRRVADAQMARDSKEG